MSCGSGRSSLALVDAAQHGGGDTAGLPRGRIRLVGIAIRLLGLDVGEMDDALLGADNHGADAADLLAPAGIHVAENDRAVLSDLDDGFGRHIVHELGAGHLALNVLDDRDRRLGRGGRSQRQQAEADNNRKFHFWDPIGERSLVSRISAWNGFMAGFKNTWPVAPLEPTDIT